jgi:hypothetical protein
MLEHISSFANHSRFRTWAVNSELGFPEFLREYEFQVIVLHYSLFGWSPFALNEDFLSYIEGSSSSYKIAFFQDEYRWWPERASVLNRCKVDCVYTCVEPPYYKDTYQKYTKVPKLRTYIPGYVSDEMLAWAAEVVKPESERTVDIGYRGRISYHYMGKAAREKHEIGLFFKERCNGSGLVLDIETEESKRIYGRQWIEFLANCRATLGVEAGVSVFDTDDTIFSRYEKLLAEKPDITFDEVYERLLVHYDGKGVRYRTISPRVFEAAAVRTCQILYEGDYSGILEPMVHYIPLKKDFSNFDDVMKMYRDEKLCRSLTDNAYRDLIASGKYSYKAFMEKFDEELIAEGIEPNCNEQRADQLTSKFLYFENHQLIARLERKQVDAEDVFSKYIALQDDYVKQQTDYQKLINDYQKLLSDHPIKKMIQTMKNNTFKQLIHKVIDSIRKVG